MKFKQSIIFLLLFATISSPAQTTDNTNTVKVNIEVDEFTNKKKVETDAWLAFGQNKKSLNFLTGKLIVNDGIPFFYLMYSGDIGCIRQNETVLTVKLSNEEIIEFVHTTNTKCGKNVQMRLLPLSKGQLELENWKGVVDANIKTLEENNWVTIRLTGTDYYADLKPSETRTYANDLEREMNEHLYTYTRPQEFFKQHLAAVKDK